MRIVFMGTPGFAVPSLDALTAAGHQIVAAYTQPPRRAGRGKVPSPSPVQIRAAALGIEVRHPSTLRDDDAQTSFAKLGADLAVVAAYGLILPQPILDAPELGCINVHASLLPRWRGAAPIQRAILAGDKRTGVTIMKMEAGLDTGPMLATVETTVAGKTGGVLTDELAHLGARLLVEVLSDLPRFKPVLQPDCGILYAPKVDKSESHLDFVENGDAVVRKVRAFSPTPGAWFVANGERVRVLDAESLQIDGGVGVVLDDALTIGCASGAVRPRLIQRGGRGIMTVPELLRGFTIPRGTRLA